MSPEKLNRSMTGLQEVINHHVPYEVRMMRQTYAMLANGSPHLWFSQPVINALIESFCLHARSLIEFFSCEKPMADNTAAAKHFAKEGYQPCSDYGPSRDLMGKLNGQIAHPSYTRTSANDKKVSAQDRATLMKFVENELVRFSSDMKETYKQHWPIDMRPTPSGEKSVAYVQALGPAGATNQITTTTTTLTIGPAGYTAPIGPFPAAPADRTDGGENS